MHDNKHAADLPLLARCGNLVRLGDHLLSPGEAWDFGQRIQEFAANLAAQLEDETGVPYVTGGAAVEPPDLDAQEGE